jgi:hypothetical protein
MKGDSSRYVNVAEESALHYVWTWYLFLNAFYLEDNRP